MARLSKKALEEFYKDLPTGSQAESGGFAGGALTKGEAVGKYLARRAVHDYEQVGRVGLEEMRQTGETKRTGVRQAGETERAERVRTGEMERLLEKHSYERPLQTAKTGYYTAGADAYGAETKGALEEAKREESFLPFKMRTLSRQEKADIRAEEIFSKRGEIELDDLESALMERAERIKREKERKELQSSQVEQAEPATPAERQLRPGIKSLVWEGTPTKTGLNLPGLLAPVYGYKNIMDWYDELKSNVTKKYKGKAKEAYEYAFPRR